VGGVAKPEESNAAKTPPSDKLKLSKDSLQSKAEKDSMEQIAKQRAKTEANERAAELAKNIEELNQLAKVSAKPTQSDKVEVSPSTDSVESRNSALNVAKSGVTAAPALPAKTPTASSSTPELLDYALQKPEWIAALVALLGLGGFGLFRKVRSTRAIETGRKESSAQWETNASTSFDTVGGQRVDTSDNNSVGLVSMAYPDSQLEAVNELDPVAEAEVYLAYGKDVPAEEILQEGLQHDPTRIAIHLKLLSIYAKRGDLKSFESMAREAMKIVDSGSTEWGQVQEMGKSLDPSNPLYGQPSEEPAPTTTSSFAPSLFSFDQQTVNPISAPSLPSVNNEESNIQRPVTRQQAPNSRGNGAPKVEGAIDFDLGTLAVSPMSAAPNTAQAQISDRLDATLALAEQFIEIDEKEGARALLDEVIAGGDEALRQRAKALLAKAR
jgi:pilus assembly protein FimV